VGQPENGEIAFQGVRKGGKLNRIKHRTS
jgi:hypothetical protein